MTANDYRDYLRHREDLLRNQTYRDHLAHRSGWPVPPTIDEDTPPGVVEMIQGARAIEGPVADETPTRAQREQAAHDAVEDAVAELASSERYFRRALWGLLTSAAAATGAATVMALVAWWLGLVPLIVSVAFLVVNVISLADPPKNVDTRADAKTLRQARRRLRDVLTEGEGG